ncbi:MAG TPA: hypothetical protein VFC79_09805 [Tissierellaceae bacterium]|nr:hypothetical protein [Tissierellaceae bacterium]
MDRDMEKYTRQYDDYGKSSGYALLIFLVFAVVLVVSMMFD